MSGWVRSLADWRSLCEHRPTMTEPPDDAPHDILAADEFSLPGGDASLRRDAVRLPDEPYATPEPHDVLAAEEFAVPAGRLGAPDVATSMSESESTAPGRRWTLVLAGAVSAGVAGAVALVLRRRR